MSKVHIQSEIRIADLLAAYNQQEDFYICYVVANALKPQIENIPGFQEFCQNYYDGDTGRNGLCYSFLLDAGAAGSLCEIVVGYFNLEIEQTFPDVDTFFTFFSQCALKSYATHEVIGACNWNRSARINMMKCILAKDPEAVISVNLVVGGILG